MAQSNVINKIDLKRQPCIHDPSMKNDKYLK